MDKSVHSTRITRLQEDEFEQFTSLLCALADYEKLERPTDEALGRMKRHAFAEHPHFEAYLVRLADMSVVGYIILFTTYSSFLAQPTLFLEDLFILPEHRRQGIGRHCFQFLALLAKERDCGRIEWQVLDWNEPAVNFYNKLGASHMKEWYSYRLVAHQFDALLTIKDED